MSKIDPEIEYKLNPFVYEQDITINIKKKKIAVVRGTELHDEEGNNFTSTISQVQEVDKEEFMKIFTGQIKLYFDLSQTAFKLFFIIIGIYQKAIGKDEIYLSLEEAKEESLKYDYSLSKAVYYRAIKELIEKNIIAKSNKRYIFFINPAVVFNGDRAKFVKEIKIKKEKIANEKLQSQFEEKKNGTDGESIPF
ncbi:hypothetical protein ACT8N9_004691 [Escherichia coli]